MNRLSVSPEAGKATGEIKAYTGGQAAESKTAAFVKTPPVAGRTKPAAFNFKQLIHSLGLPGDRLSAALTGFARAFSLPLEPALLSRLRREALTLKARHGDGFAGSGALAATAAAGKGVALSAEALEQYARAIDPDYAAGQDKHKDGEKSSGEAPFGGQGGDERGDGRENPGGEDAIRVIREILEKALKRAGAGGETGRSRTGDGSIGDSPIEHTSIGDGSDGDGPLLSLLNRLPGRDGNFWAVYPLEIKSKGLEIRLSVWVLLDRLHSANGSAASPVRSITVNAVGEKRRWVFGIKNPGGPGARTKVLVSPFYGETERKRIEGEIRNVLGDFGGKVSVEDGGAVPMPETGDAGGFFTRAFFPANDDGFSPVEEDA